MIGIAWAAWVDLEWYGMAAEEKKNWREHFALLYHDCNSCTVTSLLIFIYAKLTISLIIYICCVTDQIRNPAKAINQFYKQARTQKTNQRIQSSNQEQESKLKQETQNRG